MSAERVTWWSVFAVFFIILLLTFFTAYISLLALTIPEGLAYIVGLIIFLLLGNRLLFGYAGLLITLENLLKEEELDRDRLVEKSKAPLEMVKDLSNIALIALWLKDVDYYRYTYYGIFSLLMLFALLSKMDLIEFGNYVEGSFWGASAVTVLIWSLDISAHYLMGRILEKEVV